MPETLVLQPVTDAKQMSVHKENYEKVISWLNEHRTDETDIVFDNFLSNLGIDFETYPLAVRSMLTRPKIFLKQSVRETRLNNYNPILLKCWEANMDLQYILDPYSCFLHSLIYF